jgi:hypothetical protein
MTFDLALRTGGFVVGQVLAKDRGFAVFAVGCHEFTILSTTAEKI